MRCNATAAFQGNMLPFPPGIFLHSQSIPPYQCSYTNEGQIKVSCREKCDVFNVRNILFFFLFILKSVSFICSYTVSSCLKMTWDSFLIALHFLLIQTLSVCLPKALIKISTISYEIQHPNQHPPFKGKQMYQQSQLSSFLFPVRNSKDLYNIICSMKE